VYYDWLERAFLGGVKLMVMHAVNNEVLCKTVNHVLSCNHMDTVDMQIAAAKHLEAHVGWYRIAYSAEQARQIINSGRMAVVLGIEVDELFNCRATGGCNGITEVSVVARDDAGNHADARTTVSVDKSVPVVGCGSPDGNWHAADAQIPCTASDAVSGLARADDASFVLTTAVPGWYRNRRRVDQQSRRCRSGGQRQRRRAGCGQQGGQEAAVDRDRRALHRAGDPTVHTVRFR
jgi:hypothetical protein